MDERIEAFVDWFIRTEYVCNWQSECDSDFINYPDRAARCYDAAEYGADGKTHYEVINDWRSSFKMWIREGRKRGDYPLFEAAVEAHWDALETWHEKNGSLHQQIG